MIGSNPSKTKKNVTIQEHTKQTESSLHREGQRFETVTAHHKNPKKINDFYIRHANAKRADRRKSRLKITTLTTLSEYKRSTARIRRGYSGSRGEHLLCTFSYNRLAGAGQAVLVK